MEIKKIMIMALAPWCLLFLFIQGCEITGMAASRFISAEPKIIIQAPLTYADEFIENNEHTLSQRVQQENDTATDTQMNTVQNDTVFKNNDLKKVGTGRFE
jgi:hypothetical protein